MRIGYFGDGRWARRSFERIADADEFEAAYVVARHENPDSLLREYAQKLEVPFFSPSDVNEPSFLDELAEQHSTQYTSVPLPDVFHYLLDLSESVPDPQQEATIETEQSTAHDENADSDSTRPTMAPAQ